MKTILLAIALIALMASRARAGHQCLPRAEMLLMLAETSGQVPVAAGLAGNDVVLEVIARPDGARWTVLGTRPDGLSCVLTAGTAWTPVVPAKAPPPQGEEGS